MYLYPAIHGKFDKGTFQSQLFYYFFFFFNLGFDIHSDSTYFCDTLALEPRHSRKRNLQGSVLYESGKIQTAPAKPTIGIEDESDKESDLTTRDSSNPRNHFDHEGRLRFLF